MLAITDGLVEDMEECVKLLGKCSQYPMSIVIVGVGDENFESMRQLEDIEVIRKGVLEYEQDKVRDIIQFIAYKDVDNQIEELTARVLKGCGKQFLDYMKVNGKMPSGEREKVELSKVE